MFLFLHFSLLYPLKSANKVCMTLWFIQRWGAGVRELLLCTLKPVIMGSRRPHGSGWGSSSGMEARSRTGMVSTELTVPEPEDDWLPEVGADEELEPLCDWGWDWVWDWECVWEWEGVSFSGSWDMVSTSLIAWMKREKGELPMLGFKNNSLSEMDNPALPTNYEPKIDFFVLQITYEVMLILFFKQHSALFSLTKYQQLCWWKINVSLYHHGISVLLRRTTCCDTVCDFWANN